MPVESNENDLKIRVENDNAYIFVNINDKKDINALKKEIINGHYMQDAIFECEFKMFRKIKSPLELIEEYTNENDYLNKVTQKIELSYIKEFVTNPTYEYKNILIITIRNYEEFGIDYITKIYSYLNNAMYLNPLDKNNFTTELDIEEYDEINDISIFEKQLFNQKKAGDFQVLNMAEELDNVYLKMDYNNNYFVCGQAGSGKNIAISNIFYNLYRKNTAMFIIDENLSFKYLTHIFKGNVIKFDDKLCLNPFTNIDLNVDEHYQYEIFNSYANMILQLTGIILDEQNEEFISIKHYLIDTINSKFKKHKQKTNLKHILKALKKENAYQGIQNQLEPFVNPDSKYFNLFNGENNLDLTNSMTYFDINSFTENNSKLSNDFMTYIFLNLITQYRDNNRMTNHQRFIVHIEDSWRIQNKFSKQMIENCQRTFRKLNGGVGLSSMFLQDHELANIGTLILLEQNYNSINFAKNNNIFDEQTMGLVSSLKSNFRVKNTEHPSILVFFSS